MKKIYFLLLTLCILNVFDYYTTIQALDNGATESNPISNFFITQNTLLQLKLLVLGLLSIYLIVRAKKDLKSLLRVTKLLFLANAAYILIVLSNLIVNHISKKA